MLAKDEIRSIIVDKFGITDLKTYETWLQTAQTTPEIHDVLSPDNVYSKDFWEVAEELFAFDPVSNCLYGRLPNDEIDCNARNMYIAQKTGILQFIHPSVTKSVLDVGAGYGWLKDYLNIFNKNISYTGVDVVARKPFIQEVLRDGFLTDEQKSKKYDVIICSNVLQHFSRKQKEAYMKDLSTMFNDVFVFNTSLGGYIHHYGQVTPCLTPEEWKELLDPYYRYVYQYTYATLYTFVCYKK